MDEGELGFLQREFARKDYQGLTREQQINLHARRSDYAKQLGNVRYRRNASLDSIKNAFDRGSMIILEDRITAGGVRSAEALTPGLAETGERSLDAAKRVLNTHRSRILKGSKDAANTMRDEVIKGIGPKAGIKEINEAKKYLNTINPLKSLDKTKKISKIVKKVR